MDKCISIIYVIFYECNMNIYHLKNVVICNNRDEREEYPIKPCELNTRRQVSHYLPMYEI